MTRLDCCQHCDGFLPPGSPTCPHCGATEQALPRGRFPALRSRLGRLFVRAAGLAAVTVTLMACYGAPYDCYEDECYGGCYDDSNCATGEYCTDWGICEWGGFCTGEDDCGVDYQCDIGRSTCEPEDPGGGCDSHDDCGALERCEPDGGICVGAEPCSQDVDCSDGEYCDAVHSICLPCESGECGEETCEGEIICSEEPPVCPEGTSPGIADGCYSGSCIADAECAAMICPDLTDEDSCRARDECKAVYIGLDCRDPDGGACSSGSASCECDRYEFDECAVAPPREQVSLASP